MDANLEADDLTHRTTDLLGLYDCPRWTVLKTLRPQSVAEHCFGVAVIALELLDRLSNAGPTLDADMRLQVLEWAIAHDAPETLTGDIDGKFKREFPVMRSNVAHAEAMSFPWYNRASTFVQQYPYVNAIVKLADKIEAAAYIRMWGKGGRCDLVYHELVDIIYKESTLKVAAALSMSVGEVLPIVRHILTRSTADMFNIQERMNVMGRETKTVEAEPQPAGHGQQGDSAST